MEEGHRGTAIPGPPSVPAALKPEAHHQHQQDQDGDQQHAQKHQGQQQLPQQPEAHEETQHAVSMAIDNNQKLEMDFFFFTETEKEQEGDKRQRRQLKYENKVTHNKYNAVYKQKKAKVRNQVNAF